MSQFWHERFAVDHYIFGTEPNEFLASQAGRLRPGMRALAIADGEGRNGVWLARQGLSVHAVDASPVALAKAQKLAATHGVTVQFEEVDLLHWCILKEGPQHSGLSAVVEMVAQRPTL